MESSSPTQTSPTNMIKGAIHGLTQGQHLIEKLREMRPKDIKSDLTSANGVVGQILEMFENTLLILTSSSFNDPTANKHSPQSWDGQKSEDDDDDDETVKTLAPIRTRRGCYIRRKNSTIHKIVTSHSIDDGYAWRKYGQKVILNEKHQRNYYRCSYKIEQGCLATKQVQMTEDEPPKYKITYNGYHTCNALQKSPRIILGSPDASDNSMVLNFETKGFTENKRVDPCSPSMRHKDEEGFMSLGLKNNQTSSLDHYLSWDLTNQVTLEPLSMILSSGLELDDMIASEVYSSTCSTPEYYHVDDILDNDAFDDFSFESCS